MMPFTTIGPLFRANIEGDERVRVNQGGTSSGKTYTLMQVLFYLALIEPGSVITVVGQDFPNLRVGALRDARTIRSGSDWLCMMFTINESAHFISCRNGSMIEFNSYQTEQDAKSGKRDYLFVNECNGVPYGIYWQLQMRTRKRVFLDYNPSERFWCHDEVIGREGVKLIISDHRGNPFLSKEEHERIESISDPELWKVYARGLTGKIEGLVLKNWDIVDAMPPMSERKMTAFGLDFGFTNDPSALEEVCLAHGDLWVDERIYETGMTNPMIAERAKSQGMTRKDCIIADCAEPKSIAEIRAEGMWIVASPKGADSIVVGLDILRRYKIHFTRRSKGIIANAKSYKWKKDRDGKRTNDPEDRNNHGIDALRYVALDRLKSQRRGTARAHYNKLD
jgi:phage terminase large subunit